MSKIDMIIVGSLSKKNELTT